MEKIDSPLTLSQLQSHALIHDIEHITMTTYEHLSQLADRIQDMDYTICGMYISETISPHHWHLIRMHIFNGLLHDLSARFGSPTPMGLLGTLCAGLLVPPVVTYDEEGLMELKYAWGAWEVYVRITTDCSYGVCMIRYADGASPKIPYALLRVSSWDELATVPHPLLFIAILNSVAPARMHIDIPPEREILEHDMDATPKVSRKRSHNRDELPTSKAARIH